MTQRGYIDRRLEEFEGEIRELTQEIHKDAADMTVSDSMWMDEVKDLAILRQWHVALLEEYVIA